MLDPQTVNQMKNLANAFDDIDQSKSPQSQGGGETGASMIEDAKVMANILGKLSVLEGFDYDNRDYTDLKANAEFHQNTQIHDAFEDELRMQKLYGNPDMYQESYVEGEIPQDVPVYVAESIPVSKLPNHNTPRITTPWSIISEDVAGLKNVKKYSIQNAYNNQVIIEGIMMQEAAYALLNVLNEGGTLTNPKVLGIISYGIQYTSILEKAIKSLKDRQAVLRESNYSRAAELDVEISEQKKKAQTLKESINSFISANGFSTK